MGTRAETGSVVSSLGFVSMLCRSFVRSKRSAGVRGLSRESGGELDSTGQLKGEWRAVVGQRAT